MNISIRDLDKDLTDNWQIYTSDEFYNKVHELSLQLLYTKNKHKTLAYDLVASIAHQVAGYCVMERMEDKIHVKSSWIGYILALNKRFSSDTLKNETSTGYFMVHGSNYEAFKDYFDKDDEYSDDDEKFSEDLESTIENNKEMSISNLILTLYTKYSRYHPSTIEFKNGLLALISTIFYERPISFFSENVDGYKILSKIVCAKLLFRLRGLISNL